MNEEEIRKKIESVENQLKIVEVNPINYDYYEKLLCINRGLWDLLYFKAVEEEGWLDIESDEVVIEDE